jgi:hypothetical protein
MTPLPWTLLGVAQLIMLGELAVNRVLDICSCRDEAGREHLLIDRTPFWRFREQARSHSDRVPMWERACLRRGQNEQRHTIRQKKPAAPVERDGGFCRSAFAYTVSTFNE